MDQIALRNLAARFVWCDRAAAAYGTGVPNSLTKVAKKIDTPSHSMSIIRSVRFLGDADE